MIVAGGSDHFLLSHSWNKTCETCVILFGCDSTRTSFICIVRRCRTVMAEVVSTVLLKTSFSRTRWGDHAAGSSWTSETQDSSFAHLSEKRKSVTKTFPVSKPLLKHPDTGEHILFFKNTLQNMRKIAFISLGQYPLYRKSERTYGNQLISIHRQQRYTVAQSIPKSFATILLE